MIFPGAVYLFKAFILRLGQFPALGSFLRALASLYNFFISSVKGSFSTLVGYSSLTWENIACEAMIERNKNSILMFVRDCSDFPLSDNYDKRTNRCGFKSDNSVYVEPPCIRLRSTSTSPYFFTFPKIPLISL